MDFLQGWAELTATQVKLAETAVVVVFALVVRRVGLRGIQQRVDDPDVGHRARKLLTRVVAILTLGILAWVWIEPLQNVGTFLGLVSAGVAIALSDLLKNIAGWLYVVTRRPYLIDDRIQIGDIAGDVIDIRLFRTSMLEIGEWVNADQSTGRIVHVPNGRVLSDAVQNYTQGFAFLWHEVSVLVTFESDWERAEKLIEELLTDLTVDVCDQARREIRAAGKRYKIRYTHLEPKVWLSVRDSGVELTGRMLVPVRQRRSFDEKAWRGILKALSAEPSINLAYPTVRVTDH